MPIMTGTKTFISGGNVHPVRRKPRAFFSTLLVSVCAKTAPRQKCLLRRRMLVRSRRRWDHDDASSAGGMESGGASVLLGSLIQAAAARLRRKYARSRFAATLLVGRFAAGA